MVFVSVKKKTALVKGAKAAEVLTGAGASAACAYLFYRSVFGLVCAVAVVPFMISVLQKIRAERENRQLLIEFQSVMESLGGSLMAGYSPESAFVEAQTDLRRLYGKSQMEEALEAVNRKVYLNQPVEEAFYEYALKTGLPELCEFAEIFRYAKKSGGNLAQITHACVGQLTERANTREEIRIAFAAKRMEARMLLLLIPGILAFVTVSSPEYASTLYHTAGGALIMSIALAGYLAAAYWAMRITDIRV